MPKIHLATPRGLPKPARLGQRVVVLDIAFASSAGNSQAWGDRSPLIDTQSSGNPLRGQSFDTITRPFIAALGNRLACWIDHHDSIHHADYANDPRFVLRRKAEHPACPELVTPERVAATGAVDSIVCHTDFDGLASAAKWLCGGVECYPGCDADARAIDSRIGTPGPIAARVDRALRGASKDAALKLAIVDYLRRGADDPAIEAELDAAGAIARELELRSLELACDFQTAGPDSVWLEVPPDAGAYDKTALLLEGQARSRIALVVAGETLTLAAAFDSGLNFLEWFGVEGGMPTVLSLHRTRLPEVLARLASR